MPHQDRNPSQIILESAERGVKRVVIVPATMSVFRDYGGIQPKYMADSMVVSAQPGGSHPKGVAGQAALSPPGGRRGQFPLWPTLVRLLILATLIPATWLGIIAVPPAGAVATMAVMGAYVLILAVGARRFPVVRRPDLVLVLDLTVITALLVLSGGLNSPFLYLYYLAILEAAVSLDLRQALAAAIATTALLLLLWTAGGQAAMFETAGFHLGAFMAGGFLLALVLGMVAQEHRASAQQARWNLELDRRLAEATRELEARVEELETYNGIARQLSGELRVDGVMDALLAAFRGLVGVERGVGHVVTEAGGMRASVTHGALPQDTSGVSAGPALPATAAAGEVHIEPQGPPDRPQGWWCSTALVRSGQPRAWLTAYSETPFVLSEPVRQRIRGLATQSVAAVEAARLHEEVQRMIRTDPMRALCSWPTFEQLLRDEIERCRSLLLVFSVAEVQLEDYAATRADAQDRDLALRRAVKLLQAPLRRVDVLSYDGAGRFALLLPRVPKVRALEETRELVSRLERDDVATRLLMVDRLALSAGVVSFPEDGATPSDLLAGLEAMLVLGPGSPVDVRSPAT
jgi:GGDEF domain-containing protein